MAGSVLPSRADDLATLGFTVDADPADSRIRLKRDAALVRARKTRDADRIAAIDAAAGRLLDRVGEEAVGGEGTPAVEPVRVLSPSPKPGDLDLSGYRRPARPKRRKLPLEPLPERRNPSLLIDFPRGDPARPPVDIDPAGQAPFAHFTPTDLLRSNVVRWRPGRLLLGVIDGREALVQRSGGQADETCVLGGLPIGVDDNRHACTFAGSRAGKGRSAIVGNTLLWPGSLLATDPKGELAVITARRRAELGAVHILDPFGVAAASLDDAGLALLTGFNPIAAMREDRLAEDAALIADAIVLPDSQSAHWSESAKTFIEGLVLHVRTDPRYAGRRHLGTVRLLAGQGAEGAPPGEGMAALAAEMAGNRADPTGLVRMAAADYAERPDQERGSLLSTVRRHLKFIDLFQATPLGRMTLEHDGFRLDALKREVTTVYLCLPARHLGTCGRWLRLFVNLTLQAMETTRTDTLPGDAPLLCLLDEFASLGHLSQLEAAAAQIAGFNVILWPILQDVGQIKALYGERWETFLANAGLVQCFGNSDLATLEWISKRLGTTLVQLHQRAAAGPRKVGEGGSEASGLYDLMTPEEVARFFGRDDDLVRQLVIWAGRHNPFLVLQRVFYDQHELFIGRDGRPMFDDPP